ncbi:cytosolic carboxypeptidase 3 isoform X2 [Pseudophryne corroboree]|uniref:cytosolic carboxypeptidase 3 isoform X2 n=1 Tax=Pseudophryne corroboree TaxID=495146 RepID=UPI0030813239
MCDDVTDGSAVVRLRMQRCNRNGRPFARDEDPYESETVSPYELYSAEHFYYPHPRTTQVVYENHCGRKLPRLREPRDLYGVSSASFFQLPRWPYECQVLRERIQHIEWNPPVPEPMYRSTGLEQELAGTEHLESKVIYQVKEGWKESYFMCSRVGGNRSPLKSDSSHSCEDPNITLEFESRFESGNLQKVVQVGDYDYQLTLRTDLYTSRHTQWFYFRVKNTRAGVPYRFTIINFMKRTSLYNHGMRPLMYSETEANTREIGWHRIGDEIKYYKNNFGQDGQSYYSLSWTFSFPHNGDVCYFAHCYPYTYSNLQDYLSGIANDPERSRYCKIRVLCHSLAGNMVYVLTITNPSPATKEPKKKKAVILTARVHPGETNSSWVMKGFLDYILSSELDAQMLRDTFVFKVVPMLNPDGVIVGNYRCSLTGRDLNRNYKSRLKDSFPSIWYTRNLIKRVMEEREIQLYCDLHGHSKKQNVFMYGCKGRGGQNGESRLCERIFPFMLSKNSPDQFSFSACKFRVQKNKEGTGRVVMWKMGIRNSYTLEATFCGSTLGKRRGTHFSTKDLESLGYHFCSSLLDYCDPEQTKYCVCLKELEEMVQQRVRYINPLSLQSESFYKDVLSDLDSSTGGSDSSDSNGPPAHLMELACRVKSRKKLLKSKRERNSHRKESERNLLQDPLDEDESTGEKAGAPIVDQQLTAMAVSRTFLQKNSAGSLEDLRDPISDLCSQEKPRNLPQVSRRNKMTLSKPQRQPLFQDLGAKKVSVIYLLFNANGEVITSKSHSYARNQGVMDVVSPLNGFHWNRPLPLFKNLFAQHFPLGSVLEPYCYSVTPAGSFSCKISGGFKSNTASDGCELDSGDRVHKPEKAPFPPSVYNQDKSSYSKRIWARELTLDMDTRCSLLPEPASQDLLPMNLRANGPALPPVLLDTEVLNVLHQTGNSLQSVNKTCTPALPNRDEQGGSSRITEEMQSFPHVKKMTSLPAVTTSTDAKLNIASDLYPTSATNIRHLRNILPKMRGHASASKSSSNANIPPSRRLKGRSMVHSSNGTVQKRKMGKPFCPRRQEDQTVSDSQHPDLSVNTWKDILIGLQTGQNPAAPKEDVLKHGTSNGFLNCTRKSGQRANLAPLPK